MIVIGEKINGAIPSVAKAIAERDAGFIQDLAKRQTDAGADYLDVCAGTSSEAEYDALAWLLETVQDATETPICLDSPDADIILKTLPLVSREGIINSVSEERGKTDKLFPPLAQSPWRFIALTCGNEGIPAAVEKKAEIAGTIIRKAEGYGIKQDRIFIDPLVMALSAVPNALSSFTETIKIIRAQYGEVKFTSGLSNISFGMPARKFINRHFLSYALEAGMDSAIMDPTNRDLYATMLASEALLGQDKNGRKYNRAYRNGLLA